MAVYLIQGVEGGPVKIGKADDAEARLEKIQRFSPVRLQLLAATAGGRRLEAKLHRKYSKHRLWGEWFDLPAEKLAQLKEWMDELPDWRWALSVRGDEISRLGGGLFGKVWADHSLPVERRRRLAQSLSSLEEASSLLRHVRADCLLSKLDQIKFHAGRTLTRFRRAGLFSSQENPREWLERSLRRLRERAADLRQIIEGQLPAHVLAPPDPPPSVALPISWP
jgi:hypothetical protein